MRSLAPATGRCPVTLIGIRSHGSLEVSCRRIPPATSTECVPRTGRGFSLIELMIVVAIILVIASISIPNLLRSRMTAHEASAVASLRAISSACQLYAMTYGTGFPETLAQLGPGAGVGDSFGPEGADLIDEVLASGTKSGYSFSYRPGAADSTGFISTYSVVAVPMAIGSTGQRGFYTDQTGVIRFSADGAEPTATSPAIN